MISFDFTVNKSFFAGNHPITVPKTQVDYDVIKALGLSDVKAFIVCPDATKLKGKIYHGTAGYGPYYQIRMERSRHDPLSKLPIGKKIFIQIQKDTDEALILLTLDPQAKIDEYTTIQDEPTKALFEGAVTRVEINRYERDSNARRICIEHHRAVCCVCDMTFGAIYGNIGEDYIHVHHLIPISSIGEMYVIDPVNDLRPICPNCHSMIHRTYPPMLVDDLRKIVKRQITSGDSGLR